MAHNMRQDPFNNMEAYSASEQADFDSNYPNQSQYPTSPANGMYHQDQAGYMQGRPMDHTVTPGVDNFGHSAAGGVAGLAYGVADRNARSNNPFDGPGADRLPPPPSQAHMTDIPRSLQPGQNGSFSPQNPFNGHSLPSSPSPDTSYSNLNVQAPAERYQHQASPVTNRSPFGAMDPNDIIDDGDDGLEYAKNGQRGSSLSAASGRATKAGAGIAAGAAAGGAFGQGLSGDKADHHMDEYDVNPGRVGRGGPAATLAQEEARKRTKRWIILLTIFVIIAGGIVGGVVGGLIRNSKNGGKEVSGVSGSGAGTGKGGGNGGNGGGAGSGDLNIHSPEIQSLMNNKNLHKVFPGMDYTPQNVQYPDCLNVPPSQDEITKDVAVLSQLTNTIRLYGVDCNQTEMVLYAISQLEMNDTLKVWLGVWQDNNQTTNQRQLDHMWTILDTYGEEPFKGLIVANEALFRQQFTVSSLGSLLSQVRTKIQAMGFNLPVATSDLGDDWTSALSAASDRVMANVHPFFAGVPASTGASWTYSFWVNNDGPFFKPDSSDNIITETGWPTGGGTDCGSDLVTKCANGAVAGIPELNQFMEDWVCQALTNGTEYFWFEAFDEPWKASFNVPGKEWEDKWGLMTVDREIKSGVKIPDCGGKTVK